MNGVIVVDKPKEFTSFDVVAVMRGLTKTRKIGHTGTLDPIATGVLPITIGNATKAQDILPDSNKEYCAEFQLGITTDTLDITGNILSESNFDVSYQTIKDVISSFEGDIMQVPPMYSAVQKNGVRLYDLARQGIEVEREARKINISKIEIINFDQKSGRGEFIVSCSKGTYIRSICDDFGKKLGCGAVLTSLRRTFACGFGIDSAKTLDELKFFASNNGNFEDIILPTEKLFLEYNLVEVSSQQGFRFKNGGSLTLDRLKIKNYNDLDIYRVYSEGKFLGLGEISLDKNEMIIKKLFPEI